MCIRDRLNHVYVPEPRKGDTIKTRNGQRLFAQLECMDYSKIVTLAFRGKAMLGLAGLSEGQEAQVEALHAGCA